MPKCAFCQSSLMQGRGKMLVKVSGDTFYFCEAKCEKNWKMGRLGKEFKWTKPIKKKK